MPIRINLLAEQHALEEARRRDPVKRAVWIGGFILSLFVVWGAVLQIKIMSVRSVLTAEETRLRLIEKDSKLVGNNLKKIAETERKLGALAAVATNRFLWAPVFNALQNISVDNVQITRLRIDQVFSTVTKKISEKELEKNPKLKAPQLANEHKSMIIEARDYANPAELNYNKFISVVGNSDTFRDNLEKTDGINLKDRLSPQPDPIDPRRRFIQFSIECRFPDKQRTL